MPNHTRVEFKTRDGVTLRGDFFKSKTKNAPIVVMTSGFSLVKELNHETARLFQESDISVLAYDNRSFGSSDGMPRQEIDLYVQAADFHDAITAAMSLPDVAPSKVIMMGVGHGGSAAMIAAGRDERIKAVILHAPFPSGVIDAAHFPEGIMERAWRERETMTLTGKTTPTYTKTFRDWVEDGEGDESRVFIRGLAAHGLSQTNIDLAKAAGTPWENQVTLQTFINIAHTEPQDYIYKIKHPTLYIVHAGDPFNAEPEAHRIVFGRMGANRVAEFKVIQSEPDKDFTHRFTTAAKYQVRWLKKLV